MCLSLLIGQDPAVAVVPRHRMPTPSIVTLVPGETAKPANPLADHPQDPCLLPPLSPARPQEP